MGNTDLKVGVRNSMVIENLDLMTGIEQDRFVSQALQHRRYLVTRFPDILEKTFQEYAVPLRKKALTDLIIFLGLMCLGVGLYLFSIGTNVEMLQHMVPTLAIIGLGVFMWNSQFIASFSQAYLVMLAAGIGYTTYMIFGQPLADQPLTQSLNLGFLFNSVCVLVIVARAQVYLATFITIFAVAAVAWASSDLTSEHIFAYFSVCASGFCLWLWREDFARRSYLEQFAQGVQAQTSSPRETHRARQLVVLDKKTGLANSTSFMRFLSNEWRRAFRSRHSVSLILVRLSASIETLTEHGCLDQVLTELQRYSRRPGDLVGKLDDHRFAILLSNTDISNSRRLAESLLEHLHGLKLGPNPALKVYMGVASTLPMPTMSHEDLLHKAEEALSAAEMPED